MRFQIFSPRKITPKDCSTKENSTRDNSTTPYWKNSFLLYKKMRQKIYNCKKIKLNKEVTWITYAVKKHIVLW